MKKIKFKLYYFILHLIECLFFGINYKKEREGLANDIENGIYNGHDRILNKYPTQHSFRIRYNHRVLLKQKYENI